jgi:hypothetical protein
MFSHVMVGSNDLERSRKFYDALFGKPAKTDDKGRLSYGRRAVLMVSNRSPAHRPPRQWFDRRLHLTAGRGRRLARGGCAAAAAKTRLAIAPTRSESTSLISADPTATSWGLYRPEQ